MKQLIFMGLAVVACGGRASGGHDAPRDAGFRVADAIEAVALEHDAGAVVDAGTESVQIASDAAPEPTRSSEADVPVRPAPSVVTSSVESSAPRSSESSESSESSTSESSGTSESSDAGEVGADAGPSCVIAEAVGSECDAVTGCGCAGGEICRVVDRQTKQTLCFAAGHELDYWPCDRDADCATAAVCEGGVCHPQCNDADGFCPDGSACSYIPAGDRLVCLGHCDPMPLADIPEAEWQQRMIVLEVSPAWDAPFLACGPGAYCQPGRRADALSPYASCVYALGVAGEGAPCTHNADCVSGLGCGEGDPAFDDRGRMCRRWCAGEAQCALSLTGGWCGFGGDADSIPRVGPDSQTKLGMCSL